MTANPQGEPAATATPAGRSGAAVVRLAAGRFMLWMAFAMALFQSVTVTVAWWTGELARPGLWEWLWIGLLPVLVGAYLRYFSVVGCTSCDCRSR